jgi:prevent-host-death family protein
MEVGIRELRGQLSRWLDQVQNGEDIVITERGRPVARLVGISTGRGIDRLVAAGEVQLPTKARRPSGTIRRVRALGNVSDLVREQRR